MKLKALFSGMGLVLALSSVALTARLHHPADTGNDESNIAEATALVLQNSHYAAHSLDNEVSARFLDRYLEMLDPGRLHFLASDIEEFAPYRETLEEQAVKRGDTSPAHLIFDRFLERLEQRGAWVQELLKSESFDFTGTDSYLWDRRKAPRPQDLGAAKALWRQQLRAEYLQEKLADKQPDEIVKTLSRRYDRNLHALKQWKTDELLEVYLTALTHAYDPHSDYMGRRQVEDFSIAMNLSLVGIGATLGAEDGFCKIRELVAGGPAARSKLLKPGDRITAVAQDGKEPMDVIDMPLPEAVQLIRGVKGTKVNLTFIPADSTDASVRRTITLVRDEIHLEDQEAKARIVDFGNQDGHPLRLGVIDLPSFYSGTDSADESGRKSATADVAKIITKLKREQVQGIVLDLRRNGGGSLEEAISLTGLFIRQGPVVQTKDTSGDVKVENDPDAAVLYSGPLVVLTSRLTASASEILAGALQDYGRALIVGDTATFGKGTVQTVLPLGKVMQRAGLPVHEDPGALKFTIRKFYRPDGASTQLKGVASDIVLPSPTGNLKVGESEMADPLAWDEVTPAPHTRLNLVAPYLPGLRANSAKRASEDLELAWLREDMDRSRVRLANPVNSLNEQKRRSEKAELTAQAEARKKARANRAPMADKEYEITLRNAGTAGLPEPMTQAKQPQAVAAEAGDDEAEIHELAAPGKTPAIDATLEETEHILADYVGQLQRQPKPALASKQ